jgi:hypothetical protein
VEAARRVHEILAAAATAELPEGTGLAAERAEEPLAEVRAGRDRR